MGVWIVGCAFKAHYKHTLLLHITWIDDICKHPICESVMIQVLWCWF